MAPFETEKPNPDVEILVHIGAPALGCDDAKYRAQAAAYGAFTLKNRIPLRGGSSKSQKIISESQFSLEGADDNLNSPSLRQANAGHEQHDFSLQASFVSLASVVQDSMPNNLATLAGYGSPSRVLEFYTSSLNSSPRTPTVQPKVGQSSFPGNNNSGNNSGGKSSNKTPTSSQRPVEVREDLGDSPYEFIQYLPHEKRTTGNPTPTYENANRVPPSTPPTTSSQRRRLYHPLERSPGTGLTPPSAQPRRHLFSPTSKSSSSSNGAADSSVPFLGSRRDYIPPWRAPRSIPAPKGISKEKETTKPQDAGEEDFSRAATKPTTRILFQQRSPRNKVPSNVIVISDSDEPDLPTQNSQGKKRKRDGQSQGKGPKGGPKRLNKAATGDDDEPSTSSPSDEDELIQPPKPSTPDIAQTSKEKTRLGRRYDNAPLNQALVVVGDPVPVSNAAIKVSDLEHPLLKEVIGTLSMNTRYRPVEKNRTLRPFERGYWLVDTTRWSDALRRSCWNFLTEYVQRNMGGWGVVAERNKEFTWIKLFGWGHLVGEMYMLLYLMSQRAVKDAGLRWYDAEDKMVVRMPLKDTGGPQGDQVRPPDPPPTTTTTTT